LTCLSLTTAGAIAKVTVARSSLVNNYYGPTLDVGPGTAIMTVSESIVTGNNVGYYVAGGTLESLGNNTIRPNGTNTGVLTGVGLQQPPRTGFHGLRRHGAARSICEHSAGCRTPSRHVRRPIVCLPNEEPP